MSMLFSKPCQKCNHKEQAIINRSSIITLETIKISIKCLKCGHIENIYDERDKDK